MIVTCDQCKTRFKIPDAKVTDKGVKVRCTKCQHTFRVARPPPEPVTEPPKGASFDPFAQFEDAPPAAVPLPAPPPTRAAPLSPSSAVPLPAPSPAQVAPPVPGSRPRTVPTPPPALPSFGEVDLGESAPEDAPPSGGGGLADTDLFGQEPAEAAEASGGPAFEADHGLFDMPAAPAPPPPDAEPPPSSLLADLPDAEALTAPPGEVSSPATEAGPEPASVQAKPRASATAKARTAGGGYEADAATPGVGRRISGLLVNITLAAALLLALAAASNVYMNEGKLSWHAFSPTSIAALFERSRGLVTRDVSNGIYETRSGRSVLYIRGVVENGLAAVTGVDVHAEIWDGAQLLRAVNVGAGATPTPEDLYELNGPQDVDALNQRLNEGRRPLAPGERMPFVVTFDANRTEVAGLQLKIRANPVAPTRR